MFLRLLFESFRRQRRRKLLAGLAIFLGTTAVTAMLALATTIGDRIHAELAVYGANIIVTPAAEDLAVNIGGTDIHPALGNAYLRESDLTKLRTIFWANNITAISPELAFSGTLASSVGSQFLPAQLLGYRFPADSAGKAGSLALHPSWKLRGRWPKASTDSKELVLGSKLARSLNVTIGSVLFLGKAIGRSAPIAEDNSFPPQPLHVVGIVSGEDRTEGAALMDLSDAQAFLNQPGAVSRVEVSARTKPEDAFARRDPDTLSPADRDRWYCRPYANSIAYQIREAIPGADAQQVRRVEQSEGNVLKRISGLMWLVAAAAMLAAAFAVSAAMATAVLERRGEIGLMRSLGAGAGRIALLFYTEAALLAVVAGIVGYLAGSALAATLGAHIFGTAAASPSAAAFHITAIFNPVLLPVTLGLALLVAIAGSTPSIRSALRLDPSAILRGDA